MKTPEGVFRRSRKIWRQPTLAQAIQALPSARLCLTAEFGMGSGRTTALWPPKRKIGERRKKNGEKTPFNYVLICYQIIKERSAGDRRSLKTAHRRNKEPQFAS